MEAKNAKLKHKHSAITIKKTGANKETKTKYEKENQIKIDPENLKTLEKSLSRHTLKLERSSQESMSTDSLKSESKNNTKTSTKERKKSWKSSLDSDISSTNDMDRGSPSSRITVSFQNLNVSKTPKGRSLSSPQTFESYMSLSEVQKGLKKGELIEGIIRINPKKFEDAYIMAPDGEMDIYLVGLHDRNRALHGDIVAVRLNHPSLWKVVDEYLEDYYPTFAEEELNLLKTPIKKSIISKVCKNCVKMNPSSVAKFHKNISKNEEMNEISLHMEEVSHLHLDSMKLYNSLNTEIITNDDDFNNYIKTLIFDSFKSFLLKKNQVTDGGDEKSISNKSRIDNLNESLMKSVSLGSDLILKTQNKINSVQTFHSELNFENSDAQLKKTKFSPLELLRLPNWNKFLQKTGKVVYIIEKKHKRIATGDLKVMPDENPQWALFSPKDHRIPRMKIPMTDCPPNFLAHSNDYKNLIFLAKIISWNYTNFAVGELISILGEKGDVDAETESIFAEQGIRHEEFNKDILNSLPNLPWKIPEHEFSYRKDLRKYCVFTIDPVNAKDLDDALSCDPLSNGNIQVGVHIADVSYFVQDYSSLDKEAFCRGTSVYLVQKVIPMLPPTLSEHLCSLNPQEDRLTLSVIWELNNKAEIINEEWTHSIICSCAKLSYEHAQDMISKPLNDLIDCNFPISPTYSVKDIANKIKLLYYLSSILKKKRLKEGALTLDCPKISFIFDKETKLPLALALEKRQESNSLVEEFMLLANQSAAKKIYKFYPQIALLRNHDPPNFKKLNQVIKILRSSRIHIDDCSALAIMKCLSDLDTDDLISKAKKDVVVNLVSKTMKLAKYFCSGFLKQPEKFWHYALNIPLYTHFTSPIRRYPDLIVHRLLTSSLGYRCIPNNDIDEIQRKAIHCNTCKEKARAAFEASVDLFISLFIKKYGKYEDIGIVISIMDHSFDVFLPNLGRIKRIYTDKLDNVIVEYNKNIPSLTLVWNKNESHADCYVQSIQLFTEITVFLETGIENSFNFSAAIKKPI